MASPAPTSVGSVVGAGAPSASANACKVRAGVSPTETTTSTAASAAGATSRGFGGDEDQAQQVLRAARGAEGCGAQLVRRFDDDPVRPAGARAHLEQLRQQRLEAARAIGGGDRVQPKNRVLQRVIQRCRDLVRSR